MADSENKWKGPKVWILWEQFNRLSGYALVENPIQADALVEILSASPKVRRLATYTYDENALNHTGEKIMSRGYLELKEERVKNAPKRQMERSPRKRTKPTLPEPEDSIVEYFPLPSPIDESKVFGPQMKVSYAVLKEKGTERRMSTAYVNEGYPHYGTNKHTDEPLEIFWWAVLGMWVEKEIGAKLPTCYCESCRGVVK